MPLNKGFILTTRGDLGGKKKKKKVFKNDRFRKHNSVMNGCAKILFTKVQVNCSLKVK